MRKNGKRRFASFVLAAAVILSQLGLVAVNLETVKADVTTAEEVALQDADFTGDLWGDGVWTVSPNTWENTEFSYFTYADNAWMNAPQNGGTTSFKFWMKDAGNFTLTQTVSELPAGTYTLSSYVMGSGADVSLIFGDDSSEQTSLEGYNTWKNISDTFTVEENLTDVTIGFSVAVAADGWGYLDSLTLCGESLETSEEEEPKEEEPEEEEPKEWEATAALTNGDFETGDASKWTISGGADVTYTVKTDEWATNNTTKILNIYNGGSEAESFYMSQSVTLPAGTFKVSWSQEGAGAASGLKFVAQAGDQMLTSKVLDDTTGWDAWSNCESQEFTLTEQTTVTIAFSGDLAAGYWGDLDNIVLRSLGSVELPGQSQEDENPDEDTAVEADVYVEKISGMDEDFITGADVSSYLSIINSGATFYNEDGEALDGQGFFDLLAQGGTNYIRLRVWNNPYDTNGNGYGGGNNDLEAAKVMGQYATNAGMKVLIDFHYSDFWADPGKQKAPKAWNAMSVEEKASAVSEYTTSSLKYLLDSGVDVGMVQIGNETTNAICGVSFSSATKDACAIFDAGCDAVHNVAAEYNREILAAIHFTNPERSGNYATFAKRLDTYDVSYDVFASSYYPYWHGTLDNLTSVLKNVADTYDKKVMVAETSWAWTLEDGDGHDNTVRVGSNDSGQPYDFSVQGQCTEIAAVAKAVANVGDKGIGLFYWENAWIPVEYAYDENGNVDDAVLASNKAKWEANGSGWASSYAAEYDADDAGKWYGGSAVDNQAWFDFSGKALPTVNVYNYMRTGTSVALAVEKISVPDVTVALSEADTITLPEKATVTYNTGVTAEVDVTWDTQALADAVAAGIGSYRVSGVAVVDEKEYDVAVALVIEADNLLDNSGFENGLDGWTVSNNYFNTSDASSNSRTGNGCLHFYTAVAGVESTASQTVTLNRGVYSAGAYLQGGNAGDTDVMAIQVTVGEREYIAYGTVEGWKVWSNPTIQEIEIAEDGTQVTVTLLLADLSAGVWGSFDDVKLVRTGDLAAEETAEEEEKTDREEGTSAGTGNANSNNSGNASSQIYNVAATAIQIPAEAVSVEETPIIANRTVQGVSTASETTAQQDEAAEEVAVTEAEQDEVVLDEDAVPLDGETVEQAGRTGMWIVALVSACAILGLGCAGAYVVSGKRVK
ncbi:MAG: glycosyl hydrolase 53 family protein [Lachnospiraceae bacterium]|nr:glycosyl hydrolase 53 family protein [Lachnospiraceae bacterium]